MTLWYQFKDKDYEFKVDWKDLKTAFEKILKNIAKVKNGESEPIERLMKFLIDDLDIWNIEYLQEQLQDELLEYFEQDAEEHYNNSLNHYDGSDDYFSEKRIR